MNRAFWKRAAALLTVAPIAMSCTAVGAPRQSDTERLIARITAIRGGGSAQDGIHLLTAPVSIGAEDYLLMGADNSCGRIHAISLGFSEDDARDNQWYRIAADWIDAPQFYNAHASKSGERWVTEAALLQTVSPRFQVSAEEVVWHHLRRLELIASGVTNQDERVRVMTADRQLRPWER